jgi:hypothetical protein
MHKGQGEKFRIQEQKTNLENSPRGTRIDSQCLVQRVVERDAVVSKFLPQCLLGLGLVEVGRRGTGVPSPLLRARNGDIRGGQAGA